MPQVHLCILLLNLFGILTLTVEPMDLLVLFDRIGHLSENNSKTVLKFSSFVLAAINLIANCAAFVVKECRIT